MLEVGDFGKICHFLKKDSNIKFLVRWIHGFCPILLKYAYRLQMVYSLVYALILKDVRSSYNETILALYQYLPGRDVR
jgi:hypothetical protein